MKKKPSLAKLKRKLDKRFSAWIRRRDSATNGNTGFCVTCEKWAVLQAGHFIPRQYLATRWLETNVHGQCSACNCWGHGEQAEYYRALVKRYGQEVVDELMRLKRTTVKMHRSDYETLLEKYS